MLRHSTGWRVPKGEEFRHNMGLILPNVDGLSHNTGWEVPQSSDGLVSVDVVLANPEVMGLKGQHGVVAGTLKWETDRWGCRLPRSED